MSNVWTPRNFGILLILAAAAPRLALAADEPSLAARQWWADITALAGDDKEGRLTGSVGYMRAADYVISRFQAEGLRPAGDKLTRAVGRASVDVNSARRKR
jgi:hypothetical protein